MVQFHEYYANSGGVTPSPTSTKPPSNPNPYAMNPNVQQNNSTHNFYSYPPPSQALSTDIESPSYNANHMGYMPPSMAHGNSSHHQNHQQHQVNSINQYTYPSLNPIQATQSHPNNSASIPSMQTNSMVPMYDNMMIPPQYSHHNYGLFNHHGQQQHHPQHHQSIKNENLSLNHPHQSSHTSHAHGQNHNQALTISHQSHSHNPTHLISRQSHSAYPSSAHSYGLALNKLPEEDDIRGRAENWHHAETKQFVHILLSHKKELTNLRRHPGVWTTIASQLSACGYDRSVEKCKNRWKVLVAKYKKITEKMALNQANPSNPKLLLDDPSRMGKPTGQGFDVNYNYYPQVNSSSNGFEFYYEMHELLSNLYRAGSDGIVKRIHQRQSDSPNTTNNHSPKSDHLITSQPAKLLTYNQNQNQALTLSQSLNQAQLLPKFKQEREYPVAHPYTN